jgi:hypothetical protein
MEDPSFGPTELVAALVRHLFIDSSSVHSIQHFSQQAKSSGFVLGMMMQSGQSTHA